MSAAPGGALPAQVRALLADLGDSGTTHLQRHHLRTAVLSLLRAARFAVPTGPPRPRQRRKRSRQAYAYEQRSALGWTQLSTADRIHWLYLSVQDITDVGWLSLLAEIVEDPPQTSAWPGRNAGLRRPIPVARPRLRSINGPPPGGPLFLFATKEKPCTTPLSESWLP